MITARMRFEFHQGRDLTILTALWMFALILCAPAQPASAGPVVREPGAIYIEEVAPGLDVRLDVLQPVALFADVGGTRHLALLGVPQKVELIAVSKEMLRVRGRARQGQVIGWVKPEFLSPLPEGFYDQMENAERRRIEVENLIAEREVAVGMTMDEVRRSLGKPQRRSSRRTGGVQTDVWEFVTYQLVPQEREGIDEFGRITRVIVNVKVPAGTRSVVFEQGVVTEINEDEAPARRPRPTIVPGHIEIY